MSGRQLISKVRYISGQKAAMTVTAGGSQGYKSALMELIVKGTSVKKIFGSSLNQLFALKAQTWVKVKVRVKTGDLS